MTTSRPLPPLGFFFFPLYDCSFHSQRAECALIYAFNVALSLAMQKWPHYANSELKLKGFSADEQRVSLLGITAITADAKTLWIHPQCLMETSQQALKPLRGCTSTRAGFLCHINNAFCRVLASRSTAVQHLGIFCQQRSREELNTL